MITVAQAQALIRAHCRPMAAEMVTATEALGRVLAADIYSPVNLPPFDNSAMDGFALASGGRTLAAGLEFSVGGEQSAGQGCSQAQGEDAWEIMTGARIPDGLDTVVPVEQVELLASRTDGCSARIRLTVPVPPQQHVRYAGEDIAQAALAIAAGSWVGPAQRMLLAGLGIASVAVMRRPRVAVLCTGRELVDDPGTALQPGQIRNSNGPFLAARLPMAGAELVHQETVPDDAAAFEVALARALATGAEVVLSTGAVSMGRYDFIPSSLRGLGADIVFHKLAMRPGKPLLFARLAGGQLFFGLPGNPVSSAVGLRFFVETALRVQLGLPEEQPWRLPLAQATRKKAGVRMLQKARLQLAADGQLAVELLHGQQSFKTQPLLVATAWAALPEDDESLAAGTLVEVYGLGHAGCEFHFGVQAR
ncbi:MAG: gephyrin-like molybdotransferase Glp [Arenimonas sp.]